MATRLPRIAIRLCLLMFLVQPATGSDLLAANRTIKAEKPSTNENPQIHGSSYWLLQEGLFDKTHGAWIGFGALAALALGGIALGISVYSLRELNAALRRQKSSINKFSDQLNQKIDRISKQAETVSSNLGIVQAAYREIQQQHSSIFDSLHQQRNEPTFSQVLPQLPEAYIPTESLVQSSIVSESPAQKQADITAAVNRGDRHVIKSEMQAQLNITNASENAISMGRLNETQLEEVTAGGSYWIASFAGESWLYPTEQTLKGYSQSQRPTGIFSYSKQSISSAKVLSPARLEAAGPFWQVIELGNIAIPG